MRVTVQPLLYPQRQTMHPATHVGVPGRHPDPRTARGAISATLAPGSHTARTSARFCSAVHIRRRSAPVINVTWAIAPSLTPMQTPELVPVLPPEPVSLKQCGLHRRGT